jgi:MFS family permease
VSARLVALQPLRLPNFARFWVAQALSRFGDPITLIALASVTYQITGSALATALAVLVNMLPAAVFGLAAGAVTDAFGHRRSMIACDLIRAGLIAAIPALLVVGAPLWTAFVLVVGAGICGAVFMPARVAIVPLLLEDQELSSANSLVYGTDRTVEILGAVAGGILVALLHENAFYVDALTFLVSGLIISRVHVPEGFSRRIAWDTVFAGATAGLQFIWRSAILRANTVFSLLAQLSVALFNSLLPVLIFRRFSGGDHQLGATQFGLAEATLALGAVGAALLLPPYLQRASKGRLLIVGFGTVGLLEILVGMSSSFAMLLVVVGLMGVLNVVYFVPNLTLSQEVTPRELHGRVFGARYALLAITWLPLVLAGGTLADAIDPGLLIGIGGVVTLITALGGIFFRSIRDVP